MVDGGLTTEDESSLGSSDVSSLQQDRGLISILPDGKGDWVGGYSPSAKPETIMVSFKLPSKTDGHQEASDTIKDEIRTGATSSSAFSSVSGESVRTVSIRTENSAIACDLALQKR